MPKNWLSIYAACYMAWISHLIKHLIVTMYTRYADECMQYAYSLSFLSHYLLSFPNNLFFPNIKMF